ncbi:MAG: PVC-type heme-binding CxxCH protein, partial [Actinomycetota bacterium]
ERRDERLGQVRLLEDTNGDGRFDNSRVFADDLAWPTAVICYDGGIFVGASPDIIWLKDTNGDGKADERRTVFTGFGTHSQRLNVQALLNNFTWGLDNRIHGATSRNGGMIEALAHPSEPLLDLRSRDFSFDPRTLTIRAEAGGGQHGMSFDTRGRKFVSSNSNHIQALMYEERYAARNPHYTMRRGLIDIPVDGPAAEVYRISPDEPWRVIRTRWRVEGTVPGIIEGGGRPSGYFTGASGATIYRGNALPAPFLDNVFVGDSGGNLVHRKILRTDGVQPVAERPEDEQEVEFIASRDVWFRPVDFANAPDGGIYILDMYREVIEHPWSLPEPMKQHLDLNSGNDRGRIYRAVPEDFQQPEPVRLGEGTTGELVTILGHDNGWHRTSAARLLFERQDPEAAALLEDSLQASGSGLGRMYALYALAGLDAIKPKHILAGLDDPDERVRQHAVRLSETFQGASGQDVFLEKLLSLSTDPSPFVRYQSAFTLGEFDDPGRISALAKIMTRDLGDPWIEAAVLSSLADGAGDLFAILSAGDTEGAHPELHRFLVDLTGLIAAKNDADEIERVLHYLATLSPERAFALVHALGSGLARVERTLSDIDREGTLAPLFTQADEVAQDALASAEVRIDAIALLGLTSFAESGVTLLDRVDLQESLEIQLAALRAMDSFADEALAAPLLDRWDSFSPQIRNEVLTLLLRRSDRTLALLQSIEDGVVQAAEIPSTQAAFLAAHSDTEIRALAQRLLTEANHESREDVLIEYLPSLELAGSAARGEAHYQMLCVACHRSGEQGYPLGPDLTTLRSAGKESLLVNLIDPNREVAPNYVAYLVETRDSQNHFGIIINETAQSVTLRHGFGMETVIPRAEIAGMQSQGRSIMPEGLEAALDLQDMADLLEFIITGEEQE